MFKNKKTMKNKIKISAVAVIGLLMAACAGQTDVLPCGVQYDILQVGDFKTLESDRPNIIFTQDGTFHGSTGCNRYFGEYSVDGNGIKIKDNMGMTRMLCLEADEQERILSEQLPYISAFSVKDDKLILTTSQGEKMECVKSEHQPDLEVETETEEEETATAVERAYNSSEIE